MVAIKIVLILVMIYCLFKVIRAITPDSWWWGMQGRCPYCGSWNVKEYSWKVAWCDDCGASL